MQLLLKSWNHSLCFAKIQWFQCLHLPNTYTYTYLNTILASKFIEFQEAIVVWVCFVFGNVSAWVYFVLWRPDFVTVSKNQKDPCLKLNECLDREWSNWIRLLCFFFALLPNVFSLAQNAPVPPTHLRHLISASLRVFHLQWDFAAFHLQNFFSFLPTLTRHCQASPKIFCCCSILTFTFSQYWINLIFRTNKLETWNIRIFHLASWYGIMWQQVSNQLLGALVSKHNSLTDIH